MGDQFAAMAALDILWVTAYLGVRDNGTDDVRSIVEHLEQHKPIIATANAARAALAQCGYDDTYIDRRFQIAQHGALH